jgi:tetratricopeptide (TPR) repeat protein
MATIFNTPSEGLARAQQLAQAGDFAGAAEVLRGVVARDPANFFALFMLGSFECHFGRFAEAETHLKRAVALNPRAMEALATYGNVLLELKRPAEAAEALDRALALQPGEINALIYRGLAAIDLDKREEALRFFDRALKTDSRSIHALNNRANVLIALKRFDEAAASVDALLKLDPGYVPAISNRATILSAKKDHAAALAAIDRALAFEPQNADLHIARGNALLEVGRLDDAYAAYQRVLAVDPTSAEAHLNCANVMMERGRLDEALALTDKSIALKPDYAHALLLRANILLHLMREGEMFTAYDAAVAARASSPEAHYHRGSAQLLYGRFAEGWRDFEYRWEVAERGFDRPELTGADWQGEDLRGKSIVVYSEQGLGDTIQFARFLPLLVQRGAKLTFLCHPNLVRLFRPLADGMELIASCDGRRRFDFRCALMSLPLWLGTTLDTLPAAVPYVFPEAPLVEQWRARLGGEGFKIGITWQGNPLGKIDRGRSIPLKKFAALAAVPGVRLISLQRNHGLDQLAGAPMRVETLGEFDTGSDAFVDTAAIMTNLDLFVTSDTATAHLAGALGVPVWVVLKHLPDWRFMLNRSDSPWYPTMRLFRQEQPGDWDGAVAEMASTLAAMRPA